MKFRVVWDVLSCSEEDINIYFNKWQYIPEDSINFILATVKT
jgi:hypothetical protein